MNGHELTATEADAVVTFLALAAGDIDQNQLAEWIPRNMLAWDSGIKKSPVERGLLEDVPGLLVIPISDGGQINWRHGRYPKGTPAIALHD